ncbi:disease resistance protein RGA2-like isoform X2 [Panicum virgatum]|uniref:disease resistance protein RGA2-like isoform X2 n=1 Tax=Panicum virgatum TaxID=38727 RepID=UPI0019D581EF|nr:disease resistance protein RGA2-like isoform X2 [Panicum virgatum]
MAGVLDALASYVQNMLTEMARDEVHMLLGVTGEIEKMDIKLKDLKNFLVDADRRSITDQSVQAWVLELREAMYDATNILDICQLKAMERGPSHDDGCFNPLLFCLRNPIHAHKIGNRIKNLNQRLEDIKKRSLDFNFINLNSYEDRSRRVASSRPGSRQTSGELDESSLVGENIEEDTRNLVEILTTKALSNRENNKILVYAIVGVGGIGKTTLAKKIWLSVNQDVNEIELLRRAIIEVGGDHQSVGNTRGALERALKEALNGQKILLVMDDVWKHQVWEDVLQTPLVSAALAHGSRVLITTRHDMVARGIMATKPYHYVNKLDPEDAWLLLKKKVVGNGNDEDQIELLKDIGMEIITKCDYLPLAVKVMGGLLRQKTARRREWENVLNDSIWSVSQMPEELNYAIYLSYEDLSSSLKPCFLHYSLLPKSRGFFSYEIIGMWISEGFVHGTSRDLEEIGKEYYDELIQRNLIEPDISYAEKVVCNMHDVVRSFAQYMARNEALVAQNNKADIADKINSQKFLRLSLETRGSESDELEWYSLQGQTSLRTLLSVGPIKIKPGDSFLVFSNLRTLYVVDANFDALVEYLNQLKHLRYLSIKETNTSRLPGSIGKMKFLEYISLRGCKSLVNLPNSIVTLQHLRFLNLGDTGISSIPKDFHGLTNLRILYGFPAHMDGDWCSIEELGPLCQLTELNISGLENVSSSSFAKKARIGDKVRLEYLFLECTSRIEHDGQLVKDEEGIPEEQQQQIEEVFNELQPPSSLESLNISGYFGQRLPRWMMSTALVPLGSLRILTMHNLACCTELPNGLCQLPCLEFLQIVHAPAIKRFGPEFLQPNHHCHNHSQVGVSFPRLSELNFDGLIEWEEWEWELQVKAMPMLEELKLEKCKLRRVPPGLAFHARALKKLYIYDVKHLSSLENFTSVVHLDVFRNADLERISNLPKLQKLVIVMCPKMKVLEGVAALQKLGLEDYDIETVPRYPQDVTPRQLLLDCSLPLLTSIAAGKTSREWDKFKHIQQVKAYAGDEGVQRKWYVLYTGHPFRFETNISRSAILQSRNKRKWLAYSATCTIEDEWPVGRRASTDKRQPLCLRFRCNAYRHLILWLCRECLHCNEANRIATLSDQWTEAAVYPACRRIRRHSRQQL